MILKFTPASWGLVTWETRPATRCLAKRYANTCCRHRLLPNIFVLKRPLDQRADPFGYVSDTAEYRWRWLGAQPHPKPDRA
jgi:hypothetical protein